MKIKLYTKSSLTRSSVLDFLEGSKGFSVDLDCRVHNLSLNYQEEWLLIDVRNKHVAALDNTHGYPYKEIALDKLLEWKFQDDFDFVEAAARNEKLVEKLKKDRAMKEEIRAEKQAKADAAARFKEFQEKFENVSVSFLKECSEEDLRDYYEYHKTLEKLKEQQDIDRQCKNTQPRMDPIHFSSGVCHPIPEICFFSGVGFQQM